MADTCPHGFAPGTCLICQTLGVGDGGASKARSAPTATLEPAGGGTERRRRRRGPSANTGTAERVTPASVSGRGVRPARHGLHLLGVVLGLAVIGIAAFALVGIVLSLLHVLELVAIGVGAAWGGYHVGYFRGSRRARG